MNPQILPFTGILAGTAGLAAAIFFALRFRAYRVSSGEVLNGLAETFEMQREALELRQSGLEKLMTEVVDAAEQQSFASMNGLANRSLRSQALQSLRTGAGPDTVAATLNLGRNEVRLLSKVHALVAQSLARA